MYDWDMMTHIKLIHANCTYLVKNHNGNLHISVANILVHYTRHDLIINATHIMQNDIPVMISLKIET